MAPNLLCAPERAGLEKRKKENLWRLNSKSRRAPVLACVYAWEREQPLWEDFAAAPWLRWSVERLGASSFGSICCWIFGASGFGIPTNVTRLICLNHTSLEVSAGHWCHSSSLSLPALFPLMKNPGPSSRLAGAPWGGEKKKKERKERVLISPAVKNCSGGERLFGGLVKLSDFPGFIKDRRRCKCSAGWLVKSEIRFDKSSARRLQTARRHSFIAPLLEGAVVFCPLFQSSSQHPGQTDVRVQPRLAGAPRSNKEIWDNLFLIRRACRIKYWLTRLRAARH